MERISDLVNTLARNGLPIETVVEPKLEAGWATDRPGAATQPVYFVAVCHRVEGR